MKTRTSHRIMLIVGFSALLASPAFAAFGDAIAPAANSLSGNSAAGSALPPGTYPSSPSDSDKKAETPPKEKAATGGSSHKQPDSKKPKKKAAPKDS
ncbi:hypothetical protein [Pseudomonas sp. R76]|uniref:hypothetical protein n=1 Tax=Pseudomonas sp. R76 TaxID=1573711 RepID=UPI00131FEB34|nr:hypothetical protein [Pseudomonas sp. R76]QHD06503.1 hypothetical protein PspR76_12560 [Pseudomonas sp. R76]